MHGFPRLIKEKKKGKYSRMAGAVEKQIVIWKTCPKFTFLEVSNLGEVRTKDRYVPARNGGKRLIKGRVLKQHLNPYRGGYLYLSIHVNGKTFHPYVHQIVAITFIPNPHGYPATIS